MSVEATSETMRSYLDALVAQGDFADYFTDDVTWATVGSGQQMQGREPVRDFLIWMHTHAFDARLGRLQQRNWTAEDGSARSIVEVVAEDWDRAYGGRRRPRPGQRGSRTTSRPR